MKKKLLILLIAVIPTLMPNLASAVAVDVEVETDCAPYVGVDGQKMTTTVDCWASVETITAPS